MSKTNGSSRNQRNDPYQLDKLFVSKLLPLPEPTPPVDTTVTVLCAVRPEVSVTRRLKVKLPAVAGNVTEATAEVAFCTLTAVPDNWLHW